MTTEERFERIERDLAAAAALAVRNEQAALRNEEAIKELIESQRNLQGSVGALSQAVAAHVASANARMEQLDPAVKAFLLRGGNGHG